MQICVHYVIFHLIDTAIITTVLNSYVPNKHISEVYNQAGFLHDNNTTRAQPHHKIVFDTGMNVILIHPYNTMINGLSTLES